MAISGSLPSGIKLFTPKGTLDISEKALSSMLNAGGSGSTSGAGSLSNLGNSGSGKTMDRAQLASGIRKTIGDNPDMSSGLRSSMAKLANKIDGTNPGKGSGSYGLSNGQDNKADANSLRKIADKLDGGNSAQNGGGLGLDSGAGGSQDPLQQLMKMLGMDGKDSNGKASSADKKALKELVSQLKDAMGGQQGGGNALQSGGDEDEGSGNNLEAGSGSNSGGQISQQELGQAMKEFGDDLIKGDKGGLNDNKGNSGTSVNFKINF